MNTNRPSLDPLNCMPGPERMSALPPNMLSEAQRAAAQSLIDGPRGGVFGPFIPLLRSPGLMNHLQKVGEYLRFDSAVDTRIKEFVMLIVSRQWTQQFEWCTHYPLALKAGVGQNVLDALAEGRRPSGMAADEEAAYDLCDELARTHGLSDATYQGAVTIFGESGLIDLLGLIGYFTSISMMMNVARTPPALDSKTTPLSPFPG
jgi:4-carboxymuconolactone decarboxylase